MGEQVRSVHASYPHLVLSVLLLPRRLISLRCYALSVARKCWYARWNRSPLAVSRGNPVPVLQRTGGMWLLGGPQATDFKMW